MDGNKRIELAKQTLRLMPVYHKKIFRGIEPHNCTEGITRHQMSLLTAIKRNNGKSITFYANELMVSKPNMTKWVNKFTEEGLLMRNEDENDRRITNIFITEKGIRVLKDNKKRIVKQVAMNFEGLSDSDIDILTESMSNLKNIFEKL